MSTASPPPDSTPTPVPPTANGSPPPAVSSAPPPSTVSPPIPTVNSPPPATSPPPVVSSPPPATTPTPPADPPKISPPPPPPSDPPVSPPPLPISSPPPPVDPPTPPISPPPPPPVDPPTPPISSPPPPVDPPPPSIPPKRSPPPPNPPESSPPPPSVDPSPPPPPTRTPPKSSPPPPKSQPSPPPQDPKTPPPPPGGNPPKNSPPLLTPPPPSNSTNILSPPPPSSPSPPPGSGNITVVAVGVGLGLIVLALIGLLGWFVVKRKRKASGYNAGHIMPSPYGSSPSSGSSFLQAHSSAPLVGTGSGSDSAPSPGMGNSRPWLTYEELFAATEGFSKQNILGEGGFGCVYKGCLPDGKEVAVKQLKIGSGQGEREFKAEVEIISRIHHRHLVSLVGYCISDSRRLLVYEFVPNDTLYFHLHGKDRPVMDWAMRVRVAAGAARGIAYLHEDCHPRVIHRDIKSSNILLGAKFEARVSDFGLAKFAADADTHITTRIMGTFGYMAPEYAASGKLTDKSDVYSFGVVLLEMITGRKPVDTSQPLGDENLVEWARPLLSDAIETEQFDGIADPRLANNYIGSEMFQMVEAAAACVRHSAAKRPRMSQVVRALDSVAASDLSNGMKPGQSVVQDAEEQSAEIRLFRRMAFGSQNYSTEFFSQNSMNNRSDNSQQSQTSRSSNMDLCLFDTPGLMRKGGYRRTSFGHYGVLMVIFDVDRHLNRPGLRVINLIKSMGAEIDPKQKRILCMNKVDLVKKKNDLLKVSEEFQVLPRYERHFMISGLKGSGINAFYVETRCEEIFRENSYVREKCSATKLA